MAERTCTRDDCDTELYAKSLCRRHYKQTRPRTPDVLETVACDGCRDNYQRPKRKHRYAGSFCSYLCRDYVRVGRGLTCDLSPTHWAVAWGSTCPWTPKPTASRIFQCGACGECGTPITEPTGQTPSAWCSRVCARRVERRRRRAREHDAPGEYLYVDVMRQYRRQGYVCAYCEAPCSGLPEPEHVVPLSRGGRNDMTNLVAACRTCNSDKNDMTLNEWQTDRARRGLMPVRIDGDAFTHLVPEVNTPTGTAYRHRDAA